MPALTHPENALSQRGAFMVAPICLVISCHLLLLFAPPPTLLLILTIALGTLYLLAGRMAAVAAGRRLVHRLRQRFPGKHARRATPA